MMDEISKGHLFGAYGIKVSNDMTEILQKYMIENVSFRQPKITDTFSRLFSLFDLNSRSPYFVL